LVNTYPQIKVTDAVGAIVTDFRGTDTLLEIAVFGIAALGVFMLLRDPAPDKSDPMATTEIQQVILKHDSTLENPLTVFIARLVMVFALMIAFSHWLYGGGQPGDGFTAGVIAGLAVALNYVVRGYARTRRALPWVKPRRFLMGGLILALGNAVIYAPLLGRPFLGVVDFGDAPAGLHLSSTLVFELAIALTVFGAVTLILDTISNPGTEESEG
jgi:multisubunit Na+/H+ antiporter MnhB subunit